jgi:hypothetical protein
MRHSVVGISTDPVHFTSDGVIRNEIGTGTEWEFVQEVTLLNLSVAGGYTSDFSTKTPLVRNFHAYGIKNVHGPVVG